jgi:surface antigen
VDGQKTSQQTCRKFHCSSLYSGLGASRLWRGLAVVLTLGVASAGCSLSSQFDSVFSSSDKDVTGSITPPPGSKQSDDLPPAADLAYARIAATEVLARGRKDASQPWENPATGARGTVTPIANAYPQGDSTCQDFLASYVKGAAQSWMQGEACKPIKGAGWQVRSLKAWKRS